jgi:hypothetical protein
MGWWVDVPWVRHGHERRGGQGMEGVQSVFWKKPPMHRYVPLAREARVHRQHLDCVSNGGHGDLVSVPAWDIDGHGTGVLVDLLSGVARAAIGWAGAQAKSQGAGALQPLCSRAGTRRPLSRARRRTSPSFFGNLLCN